MNLHSILRLSLVVTTLLTAAACSDSDPADPAGDDAGGGSSSSGDAGLGPTTPGALAPTWTATDFQPKSAKTGQAYGLEEFRGKTVLVAFLSAWCPYCRAQAGLLEKMAGELAAEGKSNVQIVIVNSVDAVGDQANFSAVTSFPLFQDSDSALVFRKHRTQKDDLAIYDREGKLVSFYGAGASRDLQDAANYDAIKAALIAVP